MATSQFYHPTRLVGCLVYDANTLSFVEMTQPGIAAGGGGACTLADGADVTEGATSDAAVTTDVGGTISGKLRGLVKIAADIWDSTNHAIKVNVVTGGAGGGGGASTIADGADVAQGTTTDASSASTVIGLLKNLKAALAGTVAVSNASLPLPSGASTSARQDTGNTSVASIDTKTPALGQALAAAAVPVVLTAIQQTALTPPAAITGFALEAGHLATIDTSTARIPAQGQAVAAASLPVVLPTAQITTLTPPAAITGFATETTLGTRLTESDFDTKTGSLTEAAPATDTASSGLNGRLQRIAQRLTSLIALLPAALGAGGGLKVDGSGTALPVSGTVTANAGTGPFPVSDNSGSLTVDAPVATPVFVRLSDGAAAIGTLPVSAAALPLPSNAAQETGGNLATIAAKDFATSAKQDTGNTSLTTIATNTGTTAAGLAKLEDAAGADGDAGVPALSVRQDVPDASVSAQGDYAFVKTDAQGRVWVTSDTLGAKLERMTVLLEAVVTELRVTNHLVSEGLNVREPQDQLRADATFSTVN